MLEGFSPVMQALSGTFFTWGVTALGAALVFLLPANTSKASMRIVMDGSLGFAAGVMLAASYWSLLAPAIEIATDSGSYGAEGQYVWVPVSIGTLAGAIFVYVSEQFLPSPTDISTIDEKNEQYVCLPISPRSLENASGYGDSTLRRRGAQTKSDSSDLDSSQSDISAQKRCWRRLMLLIIAITVHNFPEGLAVGVGFGAVGKSPKATFESARNLAIGIGLQNFPEGLAVSLPLLRIGYTPYQSFFWGQLSGMVEPLGGLLGVLAVHIAEPLLPYALAFAAGAMIYVVVDDLVPEAHDGVQSNHVCSWGCMIGFVVMMSMDVGLG